MRASLLAAFYIGFPLTYTSADILNEAPFDGSEESSYPQEYEVVHKSNTDQNIAVVYLAGTKEVRSVGSAASDVVTAYENLLDKIEAEKSSKQ